MSTIKENDMKRTWSINILHGNISHMRIFWNTPCSFESNYLKYVSFSLSLTTNIHLLLSDIRFRRISIWVINFHKLTLESLSKISPVRIIRDGQKGSNKVVSIFSHSRDTSWTRANINRFLLIKKSSTLYSPELQRVKAFTRSCNLITLKWFKS